jgi:hypothetical protein
LIELSTLQAVREIVTIVGVVAGLSYYFLTIQNANKARRIQLALRIAGQFQDKENSLDSLELGEMKWEDYEDFLRKYDSTVNRENYAKRSKIFFMLSETGYLLKQGLIDIETVYEITGGHSPFLVWNKFKPIFLEQRVRYEDPARLVWFEYLITELSKERVRRGLPPNITDPDRYYTS